MVNVAAILNILTTVITFVEGVIQQVAPVVNKLIDRTSCKLVLHS